MASDPQIIRIFEELNGLTARVITKISLDITSNLKEQPPAGTPVDTGWARANWVPNIGTPFEGNGEVTKPDFAAVAEAVGRQGSGEASLFDYKLAQGKVFISNNVPYITRLNDGHSKQSPERFVERAIDKAVRVDLLSIAT